MFLMLCLDLESKRELLLNTVSVVLYDHNLKVSWVCLI